MPIEGRSSPDKEPTKTNRVQSNKSPQTQTNESSQTRSEEKTAWEMARDLPEDAIEISVTDERGHERVLTGDERSAAIEELIAEEAASKARRAEADAQRRARQRKRSEIFARMAQDERDRINEENNPTEVAEPPEYLEDLDNTEDSRLISLLQDRVGLKPTHEFLRRAAAENQELSTALKSALEQYAMAAGATDERLNPTKKTDPLSEYAGEPVKQRKISWPIELAAKLETDAANAGKSFSEHVFELVVNSHHTDAGKLRIDQAAGEGRARRRSRDDRTKIQRGVGFPSTIADSLNAAAAKRGVSFSRYVLELVEEAEGIAP